MCLSCVCVCMRKVCHVLVMCVCACERCVMCLSCVLCVYVSMHKVCSIVHGHIQMYIV